jgi:uncharacterized protein
VAADSRPSFLEGKVLTDPVQRNPEIPLENGSGEPASTAPGPRQHPQDLPVVDFSEERWNETSAGNTNNPISEHDNLQANPAEIPFSSLAPQSLVFEQRMSYVLALVGTCVSIAVTSPLLIAFASYGWWVVAAALLSWLLLSAMFFLLAHFGPKLSFRHTRWRLIETGLEIHRGVWWKHQIAVPTARVQHVDVSQGPIQRMFQLGTLTIHTAGTSNASVELAGLEHAGALALRDQLVQQKESLDVT